MRCSISSIKIENNSFNACTAQKNYGGGMYARSISSCVMISGCEFQKCKANSVGGGLYLHDFNASGSSCIGAENDIEESSCVFECLFTSCSLTNNYGGGMFCRSAPEQFKMRSIQFISCSAMSIGGGLYFEPKNTAVPTDNFYCYFLFFHECKCSDSDQFGHDVCFRDYYNLFSLNSPFYESYTTNSDNRRVCYGYLQSGSWVNQDTQKKDWLKEGMKDRYVGVGGNDEYELCGANESNPCKTVKKAFEMCEVQISLAITLMDGNHASETATIDIGSKKISVIGMGKEKSSIGTGALSSAGALFSASTGHLDLLQMNIDCNLTAGTSSRMFVVSVRSGILSLIDVVINLSTSEGRAFPKCALEMELRQLTTDGVRFISQLNCIFSKIELPT
ncbi:uncharacterized protein MONOS_4232 [Monocercomonoides exilis]|uniref:uncharacterized protein n=1 Tax=Monocercomonoides exilis TaxID=2049356 RepID=UPI0035595EB3|nr:hypothetical protein MONOS_4232 [Monocercomonoides exilis]|eukprot:MONOS_4232.1-p1 / transcript=MONOS_4232.1 / gene=MONOS_4232 / organism=Monocercomonoides_exilis_PA203 / gene_product=unspecified product / transcript_product=unspecified product / location=Mono_scaffold00110:35396-36568(-) / protein_length=391 / sequence_SO=supercontig / SO=protein_coding / is_pseudo=false